MSEEKKLSVEEQELHDYATKVFNSSVNQIEQMNQTFQKRRLYHTRDIETMLKNPYQYKKELQEVSEYLSVTEGLLKEILMYKSNPLTLDHFILPLDMTKYSSKDKLEKAELVTAKFLEKYNLKYNLAWMLHRLLILGELFVYKIQGGSGIIFQELPSRLCKIVSCKNNVFKFAINLSAINDSNRDCFPDEIQNLAKKYHNGELKNDKNLMRDGYYRLMKNAYAFALDTSGNSLPYYVSLFKDLCILQDMKEAQRLSGILDNFKILIQKIPTDDDGNLLIERETAYMFNEALKSIVPEGVGVFTSPLEVEDVSVSNTGSNRTLNYVEQVRDTLYSSAGVNDEVFNGDKSSNDAILLSAMADTMLAKKVIRMFEIWINQELLDNRQTNNWKVKILTTTEKDRETELQALTTRLTTYASKKMYLAMQGFSPLDAINVVKYENMLDIGEEMKPMLTSHTLSGDEVEEGDKGGRPSNEENPDTTKKTSDSEN
jgi:hypothetical protein